MFLSSRSLCAIKLLSKSELECVVSIRAPASISDRSHVCLLDKLWLEENHRKMQEMSDLSYQSRCLGAPGHVAFKSRGLHLPVQVMPLMQRAQDNL